jgi:hypothetical protein
MHTLVLSILSLFKHSDPLRDFVFLPSPSDGECLDALLAILLLKKSLAESIRVFNNPVKILQWILPSAQRTQRVLSSPVPVCTMAQMPTWQSFYPRTDNNFGISCVPIHLLNAHLEELSESPSDSGSSL